MALRRYRWTASFPSLYQSMHEKLDFRRCTLCAQRASLVYFNVNILWFASPDNHVVNVYLAGKSALLTLELNNEKALLFLKNKVFVFKISKVKAKQFNLLETSHTMSVSCKVTT